MPQMIRKAADRGARHARFALSVVRDFGVARLFGMHKAGRPRPVAIRLRSASGRHEADRYVYRPRND